jgi:SEC-C motif
MEPQRPVEEGSSGGLETAAEANLQQEAPPGVRGLVGQMVAAGEWPAPTLVEQIMAAGDPAVESLREVLKTRPLGWPAEAPIVHAAGILSMLRPPSALPDLISAARFYKGDTGEVMADAIAAYGPEGFDTLLQLIGDPSITGYHRTDFIGAAKLAAGDDPVKRARLAEFLRLLFTRVVGEAKKTLACERELRVSVNEKKAENSATDKATQPGDAEEIDAIGQADAGNEIHPTEALAYLACDLCDLADPLARDMIRSAFEEDLIDDNIVDLEDVEETYNQGGETYEPAAPWFEEYSESFLAEQSGRERMARTPLVQFPSRTSYPSFSPARDEAPPARVQPAEPFRYTAAKIGRNDPCWCGSGKKYKRCHLGQDAPG